MRIALTCDDAPTIAAEAPDVARDPRRMDRLRPTLQKRGVQHCVAFVIGAEVSDQGPLERWLEAGFQLGNHTWEHCAASRVGPEHCLDSVRRCHDLLVDVGAFEQGRARWFRFPYLDYGADAEQRARIAAGLRELGYETAHATVDLFDDRFEQALGRALAGEQDVRAELIGARYRRVASDALRDASARFGEHVIQVPYFHFGAVSEAFFDGVLLAAQRRGDTFCRLEQALEQPELQRADGTGLILAQGADGLAVKVERRLKRLLNRLEPSAGRWLGPPWPRTR